MMEPLPDEPTLGMHGAYAILKGDDRYPLPTGQAALWAVLAGYADDPILWAQQLLDLAAALIEVDP